MINLIVAYAKNRVIGNNGSIPWNLREDQLRFKKLTLGNVVIMGRRTFEEIFKKFGRGLPGRETIVVSKKHNLQGEQFCTVHSLNDAILLAQKNFPQKDIFICGGQSIYREAMAKNLAEKLYITEIDLEVDGDAFFPAFNKADFAIEEIQKISEPLLHTYITFRK